MTSLQEMPDDILEVIYKNLDIHDAISTNTALHRRIKVAKLTSINSKKSFDTIPRYFRKYMKIGYIIKQRNIDKYIYTDVNSVICNRTTYDLTKLYCLKELQLGGINTPNFTIDVGSLTELIKLKNYGYQIINITNLTNLEYLYCTDKNLNDVSTLTKLTHLECPCTMVSNVNMLVNLLTLSCARTKIEDICNLHKLKRLYCSDTKIKHVNHLFDLEYINCEKNNMITNIDNLPKLKIIYCGNSSVKSITNLPNLLNLYSNMSKLSEVNNLPNIERLDCVYYKDEDRWIVMMRKDISDIILLEHIKENIRLHGYRI